MDETGVLNDTRNQPYFAIGMMKLHDTGPMYRALERVSSKVKQFWGKKNFEFKFADIRNKDYKYYMNLIDEYFSFQDVYCKTLVIDKTNPKFHYKSYFSDPWAAQLGYMKILLEKTIALDEEVMIVADYLSRPKSSTKYFETEIRKNIGVFNACMLESHASLFIQVIDVIIGSIVYDFKRQKGPAVEHVGRNAVCDFLKKKLNRERLAENFDVSSPSNFGVWKWK